MRIGYYIHSFTSGGAEKVAAQLTQIWSSIGHEVIVLTMTPPSKSEYQHVCVARECVPYCEITVDKARNLQAKYSLDVLVFNDSTGDEDFARVFTAFRETEGLRIAVIIHHTANNWLYTLGNTQELWMDGLFAKADALVCVDRMWALWWLYRGAKSFYIPNPVCVWGKKDAIGWKRDEKSIIWIGRLQDWAKQPEKMISAFCEVCRMMPEAKLIMLGVKTSQAERALLKNVPAEVRRRIEMPGFVTNTSDYLRRASLHVFTSLTEVTVPQVILEARSHGLHTIALDMPVLRGEPGVEIIRNEQELAGCIVKRLQGKEDGKLDDGDWLYAPKDGIEGRWRELLDAMHYGTSKLEDLRLDRMGEWKKDCVYSLLFDEIHRSHAFFARMYLPDLRVFQKWRTRLNLKFVASKIAERIIRRK